MAASSGGGGGGHNLMTYSQYKKTKLTLKSRIFIIYYDSEPIIVFIRQDKGRKGSQERRICTNW